MIQIIIRRSLLLIFIGLLQARGMSTPVSTYNSSDGLVEDFIEFIQIVYPRYLEIKDKKIYGQAEIKEWELRNNKKWLRSDDPSEIYAQDYFHGKKYGLVGGFPFYQMTAVPFEVAPTKNFTASTIHMVMDKSCDGKLYEYWWIFISYATKNKQGGLFLIVEAEGRYGKRNIKWISDRYQQKVELVNGCTLEMDETNLKLFKRVSTASNCRSFEGSIWEHKFVGIPRSKKPNIWQRATRKNVEKTMKEMQSRKLQLMDITNPKSKKYTLLKFDLEGLRARYIK